MSTETVLILGFILVVMIIFVAGMFMFSEVFGISKKPDSSLDSTEDKVIKK